MPITIDSTPLSSRSTPVDGATASRDPLRRVRRALEWYGIARTLYSTFRHYRGGTRFPRRVFGARRFAFAPSTSLAKSAGRGLGAGLLVFSILTLLRRHKRGQFPFGPKSS
jgi:hypothetical protein